MTGEDERIEMEIRKRNGESVPFQQEKIFNAMKKAFDGQGKEIGSREMDEILATVLNNLSVTVPLTVEVVRYFTHAIHLILPPSRPQAFTN